MKTIKRLRWEKKLTAEEVRHVREWCGGSLRSFTNHAARLKEERKALRSGDPLFVREPCWECLKIARKLGLEV